MEGTTVTNWEHHHFQVVPKSIPQTSFKAFHSTETALVKVQNDILQAIDQRQSVILLLLDLSAAFDTVDHSTLLSRLSTSFGIKRYCVGLVSVLS